MEFTFTDSQNVETLDKVPAQFQGLYTEADEGGFTLAENYKGVAETVDGLGKALSAARREAKEAKSKQVDVDAVLRDRLGVDGLDAAEATINELKEAVQKAGDGKVNWDKMRADLEASSQKAMAAKDEEVSAMRGTLEKYLVDNAAVTAVSEARGVPDLLIPHIRSQVKVVSEGDAYSVHVVDAAGDARGNGKGGFMTIADLVAEMKASPIFGRCFESEAPSGNGITPGTTNRSTVRGNTRELSANEKIAAGLNKRNKR